MQATSRSRRWKSRSRRKAGQGDYASERHVETATGGGRARQRLEERFELWNLEAPDDVDRTQHLRLVLEIGALAPGIERVVLRADGAPEQARLHLRRQILLDLEPLFTKARVIVGVV